MANRKLLFVFGTRPEAIKLYPLIKIFSENKNYKVKVCNTGQHRNMVKQVIDFFNIKIDFALGVMKYNQSLFQLTSAILSKIRPVLKEYKPDLVFVQGDTTSTFVGALAAYYLGIKIAHIEAGLRSYNKKAPFPEELNRILTDHLADYYFAPTTRAEKNLNNEGIRENVWVVGNTGIDALFLGLKIIRKREEEKYAKHFRSIDFNKKILLVTAHRRESFGRKFMNICEALMMIACRFSDVEIVYPVHLNPNINKPARYILKGIKNIHLTAPLSYPHLIFLMNKSYLILTDSGGIQEEAPSLGKPVLVLREVTERVEGIEAGNAMLVGTNTKQIFETTAKLLTEKKIYNKMSGVKNPYGDGKSAQRILKIIDKLNF